MAQRGRDLSRALLEREVELAALSGRLDRLASTGDSLDLVARSSGFGSAETLRRAFLRVLGVSPGSYRARFRTTGVA